MPLIPSRDWRPAPCADNVLVGQAEWCRLIPLLHRALADPENDYVFPDPFAFAEDFELQLAYWETLYYALNSLLGWQDLGLGLERWIDAGQPADGPVLQAIKQIYTSDDQILLFAAWALANPIYSAGTGRPARAVPAGWARRLDELSRRLPSNPFSGGENPLHLGHSGGPDGWVSLADPAPSQLFKAADGALRAVLLVSCMSDWRSALQRAVAQLKPVNGRNWRVEVLCRPLGSLGVYRRSTMSGRWFQGRHGIHALGYPVPDA